MLGLTLDIELFSQAHYRSSIAPDADLSELWKDVFLFHWKEESQHAIVDELEWRRCDARLTARGTRSRRRRPDRARRRRRRHRAMQAQADADYFLRCAGRAFSAAEQAAIHDTMMKAYRWQYIVTGAQEPRFAEVLKALVTPAQMERIGGALAPIVAHVES